MNHTELELILEAVKGVSGDAKLVLLCYFATILLKWFAGCITGIVIVVFILKIAKALFIDYTQKEELKKMADWHKYSDNCHKRVVRLVEKGLHYEKLPAEIRQQHPI